MNLSSSSKVFSVLVLAGATIMAGAQASRTWVSGVGDDANPCSRTAPCKTFAGAISKTAAGGEISVLDPGGFGSVTITKSITLNGQGIIAGITNPSVTGINVIAGSTDVVTIEHLFIDGVGAGTSGIRYGSGAQLNVEDTVIISQATNGIDVVASTFNLNVRNSSLTGLSGTSTGINIEAGTSGNATLDRVSIKNFNNGVSVGSGANLALSDSTVAQNAQYGATASQGSVTAVSNTFTGNGTAIYATGSGTMNVEHNEITGNKVAILADPGSTLRISGNSLYQNQTGLSCGTGPYAIVNSSGDNHKGSNTGGTLTVCPASAVTPINVQ